MKISLKLKNIKTTNPYNNKLCYLKAYIGDYKIESAQQPIMNGMCNFMEKNSVQLDKSEPMYVTFDFFIEGSAVARITLFCKQAVYSQEVILPPINKSDKTIYKLAYDLSIVDIIKRQNGQSEQVMIARLKKRKTLDQDPDPTLDEKGHIKFIELGRITYAFAKRLDPLVKVHNIIKNIILWKHPELTLMFGLSLSFLVFFPKISILLFCLFLIFGRNIIGNKIESIIPRQDLSLRLLPPQQNLQFLKDLMDLYCDVYQQVFWFLREDDRTKIIAGIQIVCKLGVVAVIMLLFIQIETLIVIIIWTALFFTSETGKRWLKILLPQIVHSNRHIDKVLKNVSKSVLGKVFDSPSSQSLGTVKQFYIYEYERWWVALNWKKQYYSNEDKTQKLHARMQPPPGWKWIDDWKFEVSQDTDNEGYEYTNDFLKGSYTRYCRTLVHVVRRRKWQRSCIKIDSQFSSTGEISRSAPPKVATSRIREKIN